jgi:hypothetical protein
LEAADGESDGADGSGDEDYRVFNVARWSVIHAEAAGHIE